jgi:large subunit ribosomal protein L9
MKLILISDVGELGKRGDVVDVADGYARNFLLPKKKAVKANDGALAQAEAIREARIESERKAKDEAEKVATQLVGTRVVLAAQAGDEGQLYGSVSVTDVVEGIRRFAGVDLDKKHVEIPKAIKSIGLHEVNVNLHPEVQFPVTLDIIPA